jgi:hypothetical protein
VKAAAGDDGLEDVADAGAPFIRNLLSGQ